MSDRRVAEGQARGPDESQVEEAVDALRRALRSLRYGSFSLTVHDGRIVQLDITEKRRL